MVCISYSSFNYYHRQFRLHHNPTNNELGRVRYQVKSRAQKADCQKADINNPINQKAEMQKTDMSRSRYVKKPTIKKPICQKADILLKFFLRAKSRYAKSRRSKS
jgi:hypothetical protein